MLEVCASAWEVVDVPVCVCVCVYVSVYVCVLGGRVRGVCIGLGGC